MSNAAPMHADARALLLDAREGVLSTLSATMSGHPFGSVVPYCLDRSGVPVILISEIAQHTRNVRADPRVALTVLERGGADVQSSGRLTLLANAAAIAAELGDAADRYQRAFPQSRGFHRTHDFTFFRLELLRVRFIGGFGDIRWIEPIDFQRANPFSAAEERGILEHMNRDHQAAMRGYLRHHADQPVGDEEAVEMVGIDGEGIDLRSARGLVRLPFDAPVSTPDQARGRLVAMARRAASSPS